MADRNALLKQIQQGKRLKKTETNDRSAPKVGNSSGGGGGPPMGGMALPQPPMPPSGGGSSHSPAESRGPPSGMPGIGGLFAGGIPKLKHRTGGIKTGRGSEDNSNGGGQNSVTATNSGNGASKESGGGGGSSRFQLPFRKNSHSSNNTAKATPPPPPPIPSAQPPPVPPSSTPPSRPGSSFSTKKAPPPPPSSKKPQIKPKPAGLGKGRMSSPTQLSPSPAVGSMPNLRGSLRHVSEISRTQSPATPSQENDQSGSSLYNGSEVIEESQGSVSSLAGRFGASVRSKAPPRPPPASSSLFSGHQRTSSGSAPSQPPPPPPAAPPAVPQRSSISNGVREGGGNVPVREGKWTFHSPSEFPPPPSSTKPGSSGKLKYPSGNSTGSSIVLNI